MDDRWLSRPLEEAMTIQAGRRAAGGRLVQSVGRGSATRQHRSSTNHGRKTVVVASLILSLAIGAGIFNWWSSTGQSIAGDVPDSPGADRQVDGLHVLNAYLVPGGSRGAYAVFADLVTTSGGADRLLTVSAGGGATTRLDPAVSGSATTAGAPVGSGHLLQIGPETGAQPLNVTGVTPPADPGTLVKTTFSFDRRGPVSILLPVWASVSGPAGPS
jgi:hypothetical protein